MPGDERHLLVLTGGHPFEAEPFEAMLASLEGWRVTRLDHPEAERAVAEGAADEAEGLLFYDMGGYAFADGAVTTRPPDPAFRDALRRRFTDGRGAVAMHHALAEWPEWPEWNEWLGGRFLYQPGEVRGRAVPDSGYRHDVAYTATIETDHPVTRGLPPSFPLTDELYLAQVFEDRVTPLIRSDYSFVEANFHSAANAVAGEMFSREGWSHPPGSNLVAWESRAENAPLIYLQPGDGPATYADPNFRRLLANALAYTADARA